MIYVHPVLGALAVSALLWIGTQGMRSRHARSYAVPARQFHRKYAKVAWILILTAALAGTASVAFLRPDLELTRSFHFWSGWSTALVACGLAWSGPQIHADADARRLHPAMGVTALVLGVLTATLGMGLLP